MIEQLDALDAEGQRKVLDFSRTLVARGRDPDPPSVRNGAFGVLISGIEETVGVAGRLGEPRRVAA